MARRLILFFLALLALIGVAAAALLIWATSAPGSRTISSELRAQLRRETGLEVAFKELGIDLFPPRIRVREISAGDGQNRVRCTIEEAEFAPRPLDLFVGVLSIEEVYLGVPRCAIHAGKKEADLLAGILEKKQAPDQPARLDLKQLPSFDVVALSSGSLSVSLEDPGRYGSLTLEVEGFGLDVTGDRNGIEVRGLVEKASGSWRRNEDSVSESLANLNFRAAVTADAVDLRHLKAVIAGASVSLRDAHLPVPLWPRGPDVADFSASVPLDMLGRLPLDLPPMGGVAGFSGQLSASRDKDGRTGYSARGEARLENGFVGDFVVGTVAGFVTLSPRGASFEKVRIASADGAAALEGSIAFDEKLSTEVRLDLDRMELARLLEQLTVKGSYVTQRMSGPIRLKGTLDPLGLEGTVDIAVADHQVQSGSFRKDPAAPLILRVPAASVRGRVAITAHGLTARGLSVSGGGTRLDVDVSFDFDKASWRLFAKTDDFHLDDVGEIAGFKMGGRGPLSCLIEGPLDDPRIDGEADIADFLFDGKRVDRAATRVHYEDALLAFDGLRVESGKGSAEASELRLDFGAPGGLLVSTQIAAKRMEIGELARIFRIDTAAYGSPKGVVSGRVGLDYQDRPAELYVEVDLVHDDLEIFGERFGSDLLRANWSVGTLTLTEFGLKKGAGTISITGTVRDDRTINFIGVLSNIESKAIDNPDFRKLGIESSLQAFVVAEGSLDHPEARADVRVGNTFYRGIRYEPSTITAGLDGDRLTLDGRLGGGAVLVQSFSADLQSRRFEIGARLNRFDLFGLFELAVGGSRASLKATGDLTLRGLLDAEPDLSGSVALSGVEVSAADFAFANFRPLNIRVEESRFQIGGTRFKGSDVVFDVSGVLGLDSLNLKASGGADLSKLGGLIGGVEESGGILDFELRADGPYGDPALSGSAAIQKGSFKIKRFPYRIDQVEGQVSLTPGAIRFSDFRAETAGGRLAANGELRLKGGKAADYQFRLQAEDLVLSVIDDLTFTASTLKEGVILRSPRPGELPTIVGDIKLSDLRYTQDIRIFEFSDLSVDRLSGARVQTTKPKLIDRKNDLFTFDIRLHGNKNLVARNNLFDVDLIIDDTEKPLRLVGTNQALGFAGRVLGKKGQVRFGGKRFELQSASVDFQDPERPDNPSFRVTADGQIRDWNVTITAEGTVEEYEVKLSSQPYLPKEDIIVLILTGMTRAENKQFGAATLTPLLTQLGPGGKSIPIEFQVYNAYSEKSGSDTTRIALGRWITPDIWVSVSSSLGQEREIAGELDYKVSDRFSVSADYQDDNEGPVGNVGLDLKFRLEF